MRKSLLFPAVFIVLLAIVALSWPRARQSQSREQSTAHALGASNAALPIVFAPAETPTTTPTATLLPAPTATQTPSATPTVPSPTATATTEPLSGNAIVNGSFENGWTDLPPAPGFLINQQPNGWSLTWLAKDQPLWDDPSTTAQGIPESLHKLADQLPPEEQPGGPQALILDGVTTYKMFHFGAPFGSQLLQVVGSLPPGSNWRFTVPVQLHLHGDNDPWSAEAGAWALTSAQQSGGWVPAGEIGDRRWFYQNVEFTVPADGQVQLLVRVKSKWFRAKDFFVDKLELRQLNTTQVTRFSRQPVIQGNSVSWGPRDLKDIPARELVTP